MTSSTSRSVRVASGGELVDVLPVLIGFQPHESVCAVLVDEGRVELCARMDLPTGDDEAVGVGVAIRRILEGRPDRQLMLVYWTEHWHPGERWAEVVELESGVMAEQVILTDGRRWWDLTVQNPVAQPVPVVAELSHNTVLASRSELAATVAPATPDTLDATTAERSLAERTISAWPVPVRIARAVGLMRCAGHLSRREMILAGLLVDDHAVVVEACHVLSRDTADAAVAQWQQIIGLLPPDRSTGALTVIALAAWLSGNGALQVICLDQLADRAPHPLLWEVLVGVYQHAVAPSRWEEVGYSGQAG